MGMIIFLLGREVEPECSMSRGREGSHIKPLGLISLQLFLTLHDLINLPCIARALCGNLNRSSAVNCRFGRHKHFFCERPRTVSIYLFPTLQPF